VLTFLVLLVIYHFWPSHVATPDSHELDASDRTELGEFTCDGRTRCAQMHSCEEAKFYLAHCPNVQMDGDHDGIPCESQWCQQEAN
jgi:hypothetical protein